MGWIVLINGPARQRESKMWLAQLDQNRRNPSCMTAQSEDSEGIPPEVLENIRGAVRIGGTFTSRNIFGEKLTLQELLGLVSPLERDGAITLCAEWNRWNTWVLFHHGTWQEAPKDQEKLLNDLVPLNAQRRAGVLDSTRPLVGGWWQVPRGARPGGSLPRRPSTGGAATAGGAVRAAFPLVPQARGCHRSGLFLGPARRPKLAQLVPVTTGVVHSSRSGQ